MFDLKLHFQTTVKVKAFDKSFEDLLNSCAGRTEIPYSLHTVDHNMTLTDTPVIPDEAWINNSKKIIYEAMVDSFKNQEKLNAEVVETVFVGFTEVKQK